MPTALKVVILVNIIATALVGLLALGIGGRIELTVFPPLDSGAAATIFANHDR